MTQRIENNSEQNKDTVVVDRENSHNRSTMTVFEHVDELRARLIKVFLAVIVCSVVAYGFVDAILNFIIAPVGSVIFTAPSDAFLARIVLALFAGCFASFPYTLFHVWQFVSGGLRKEERDKVYIYGPASLVFFVLGAAFGYFVIIPFAINFLLGFSTETIQPMITIKNYVSFVGTLVLAFGVVFELPLIMLFLAKIGVATPEFLRQKRRHAIVGILVLSAIITPPDFVTQIMMAGPLVVLYELGLMMIKLGKKK